MTRRALAGEEVSVYPLVLGAPDSHGVAVRSLGEPVRVAGVLRAPSDVSPTGLDGDPHGREERQTWYLPRGCEGLFREGAEADAAGCRWRVDGPPSIWPASPLGLAASVEVTRRV